MSQSCLVVNGTSEVFCNFFTGRRLVAYIRCTEEIHRKLKIEASTRGTSMQDLAEEFIEAGLQAGLRTGNEKVTGEDVGVTVNNSPTAYTPSVGMESNRVTGYSLSTTEIQAALNGVKAAVEFLETRLIPLRIFDVGTSHGEDHESNPNQTDATVADAVRIAAKAQERIAATKKHTGGDSRTDKEGRKAG